MRIMNAVTAALIAVLGLALVGEGAWLLSVGGTWVYVALGLGFLATAALLFMRNRRALIVFALLVLATLAWALVEGGFDWWTMVPRGDIVFLVGLWLLMPWVVRSLNRPPKTWQYWDTSTRLLTASLFIAAAVGVASMFTDVHDRVGRVETANDTPPPGLWGVPEGEWRAWGRSNAGDRWSPLAEITPANVTKLQVAWTYHTGDIRSDKDPLETTYELTPLMVHNTVYGCTPHDIVFALDADSGAEKWRYDPKLHEYAASLQHLTCRGVSYHEAKPGEATPNGECPRRLFLATADTRLIAIDADTGTPCPHFGNNGAIDLWQGMPTRQPGQYYSTSPVLVTGKVVMVAGNISDNISTFEPSGVIRGYDVNTGQLLWNWDSDNPDETAPIAPGQTYHHNSPGSWSIASADESLGLAYFPMENETPDQWGGARNPTGERFNSSIVALDIATGKLRWVFQTVHHDLWDMDIGSQPSLIDLDTSSGRRQAMVVPTKQGEIYVLDRRTGEPIVPVHEKPVPQGAAPGDHTSPTQPFSDLSFLPSRPIRESDMWGVTPFDQMACRAAFREARYEGIFTPPSVQGTLVFPGNFGIFDWGGIALDPVRQIAFTNPDYMAFYSRLIPQKPEAPKVTERDVAETAYSRAQTKSNEAGVNPNEGAPFAIQLLPFLSPLKLPCQAPPWGYVAGVDLRNDKIVWMHRNGTIRDEAPVPLPFKLGVPSLGGPLMTASGLAFLTSTLDYYMRAYDVTTGEPLWEARLPAGAQANPMSYRSEKDGRQFVVVVAGGHGSLGTKAGDSVIAYALQR
jgi:quinoprotein glucose dehydrogenase